MLEAVRAWLCVVEYRPVQGRADMHHKETGKFGAVWELHSRMKQDRARAVWFGLGWGSLKVVQGEAGYEPELRETGCRRAGEPDREEEEGITDWEWPWVG